MRVFQTDTAYSQIPTLARWIHNEWGHYHPERTFDGVIDHLKDVASGDLVPSLYIAEVDNRAVGTASLVECDLPLRSQYTPWLASVIVAEDFRHRGIASALVQYIEGVAAAGGIQRLFLFTPSAQALYKMLGWEMLEELEYREPVTVMDRKLVVNQNEH